MNNKDLKLTLQQKKNINPLLTIATINLNNADGLARTLKSFRPLRDNEEIEFIFQDGGSTDQSIRVAETFYSPREIVSASDEGIYDAMNKTLDRSMGKFIMWINSGDQIETEKTIAVMELLKVKNAIIFLFRTQVIDKDGKEYEISGPGDLDIAGTIPHQSTIYNRMAILKSGGYNKKYKITGDFDLILRMARSKATIFSSSITISRFELGGISCTDELWPQTWLAEYNNKLINAATLSLNLLKHALVTRIPFLKSRLRLKKFSAIGPERKISLYDIGAIKVT